MRLLLTILTMLCAVTGAWAADGKGRTLSGRVYDKADGNGIPFATVYLVDGGKGAVADIDGNYSLRTTLQGDIRLKVSSMGYSTRELTVRITGGKAVDIALDQQSVALDNFTVTAKYKDKLGSDATIDQEALDFIQPTSIQDLFQLLPGGRIGSNNMQDRQNVSSRQSGSDDVSAFGMGISINGIPINNDGQRIQMSGFTGSGSVGQEGNTAVNTGIDMRTISTDHIETVTINRGIASAKEGNISSGTIRVTAKQGQSPLKARVKFDPLNKLAYVGKGILLSEQLGTLYVGADIVRSASSIDDTRGAYNRVTAQANWNNQRHWWGKAVDMSLQGSYVTSFNNNKSDYSIDLLNEKYNTRYQRFMLSGKLNARLDWKLIDEIELMGSADYTSDHLSYYKFVNNPSAMLIQKNTVEGESEGEYLPQRYYTSYSIDNKPLNLFGQLTANKYGNISSVLNYSVMVGTSISYTKNVGMGAVVDPLRPPYPSSSFIRPRANKDIPGVGNHAAYVEAKLRYHSGRHEVNTSWGLRETMMLNLPSTYELNGNALLEPRLQASYTFSFDPEGRATSKGRRSLTLRAGYGEENKLPSADFLYPDKVYHDYVALNAYFDDPSKRLAITNTKIQDPTNTAIRENKNRKVELGLDLNLRGYVLSVTAFREQMNGGVEYFTYYTPTSYTYYYELKHPVDHKPTRDDFYSRQRYAFMNMNVPTNSSKVIKKGLEYRLHIPTIEAIKTEAEINGAYYNTTYSNGIPVMYYPSIMLNDEPYPYVGIYDGFETTYSKSFNTNFWFNTHLPKLKLIFTNFIQIVWFERYRLGTNANPYPEHYMDTNGEIHALTPDLIESGNQFTALRREINSSRYREVRKPVSLRMNLKLTKEFSKMVKLSFFADNILQIRPEYKNTMLKTTRDWYRPFFGAELAVNL